MHELKTCIWFQSQAEEAATYYVSLFPQSRIVSTMKGAPDQPAIAVEFELEGRRFMALNGRPERGFSEAFSIMVTCEDQADVDRYWTALGSGGEDGQCGWLKDRFGVSWQVIPRELPSLLGGPDGAAAGRALQAMFKMKKLDIAALRRAREGTA